VLFTFPESLLAKDTEQELAKLEEYDDAADEEGQSIYSDTSSKEPPRRKWVQEAGAVHSSALQVLAKAFSQNFVNIPTIRSVDIPLEEDMAGRNIIQSLINNDETHYMTEITGYSLRIFLLIRSFHPDKVQTLLGQTQFPFLVSIYQKHTKMINCFN
jgi:hypothetical protein